MFEDIDKALENEWHDPKDTRKISPISTRALVKREADIEVIDKDQDTKDDYTTVRNSLHTTLEQGQEALNALTEFVNQSPSPRAFEVLAQMIKTNTEVAKELMELQRTLRDLEKINATKQEAETINNYQINNHLTVPELLDLINTPQVKN